MTDSDMGTRKRRTDRVAVDDYEHDDRGDLVRAENFILATRDTGYRTCAYALAELNAPPGRHGASLVAVMYVSMWVAPA